MKKIFISLLIIIGLTSCERDSQMLHKITYRVTTENPTDKVFIKYSGLYARPDSVNVVGSTDIVIKEDIRFFYEINTYCKNQYQISILLDGTVKNSVTGSSWQALSGYFE